MTFFENSVRRLGTYLLAGAMAVSGCSAYIPIKRFGEHDSDGGMHKEIGARTAMEMVRMEIDLDKEKRRVPMHVGSGIPIGSVVMYDDARGIRFGLGLEYSVGWENFGFKVGTDAKMDYLTRENNQERLNLDGSPDKGQEAYSIASFVLSPFVGFNSRISRNVGMCLEIGFPLADGEFSVGQDVWNRYDTLASDTWNDNGKSITVKIGSYSEDKSFMGLSFGIERYDVELNGEKTNIDVQSASLFFSRRF